MRLDFTEPSLTTSLEGKQGVHSAYALVRGVQVLGNSSNLLKLHLYKDGNVCRVLSQELGWFACTIPSPTTSLQRNLL